MSKRGGRVRDKWRDKTWVLVEAPRALSGSPIAYVPVTDPEKAIGRVIETTLYDLLKQDPQQITQKLYFQISKIEDSRAETVLKAQEYAREYLRSLVRRGSSQVSYIKDYTTKDGFTVRVYVVVLAVGRINFSRKHAIRMLADGVLKGKTTNVSYSQFAREVVLGNIAQEIYSEVRRIVQLRHVGIRKMKLLKRGEAGPEPEEVPLEETEEAPAEAGEAEAEEEDEDEAAAEVSPAAA